MHLFLLVIARRHIAYPESTSFFLHLYIKLFFLDDILDQKIINLANYIFHQIE